MGFVCSFRSRALLILLAASARAQISDPSVAAALRENRPSEALKRVEELLKSRAKDSRLWVARGLALAALDRVEEGLASFDRALEFDPKFVPALRAGAQFAYARKDPRVESYLSRLLAIEPDDATAHGMAAVTAFERANCTAAEPHFEKTRDRLELDPLLASMYAQCLLKSGSPVRAVNVLAACLARNPSNTDVRYNLAVAQSASGNPTAALKTLETLERSSSALSLLGTLLADSGDFTRAVDALTRALRLAPDSEQPYVDLALLCTRILNWSQALEVSDEGLKRVPNSARLHSIRGVARLQLGDVEGAAADFNEADRLEPRRALGAAAQGLMLAGQGRPDDAVRQLRNALAKQPGDAVLEYLLADALERSGNAREESVRLLESSIRARPGFAPAHALLGKLYRAQGSIAEAIRSLELALTLDPENQVAAQQLILALRQDGRKDEAVVTANRLRKLLERKQERILSLTRPQ